MIRNLFSRQIKVTKKKPTIFFTFFREFKVVNMSDIFVEKSPKTKEILQSSAGLTSI